MAQFTPPESKLARLKARLETMPVIEQAMGIVMALEGPVDLGLLPLAARFGTLDRGFLAVEALRAKSQQRTRPLDGLQRALLQGLDSQAERSPALIEIPLPVVGLLLALLMFSIYLLRVTGQVPSTVALFAGAD